LDSGAYRPGTREGGDKSIAGNHGCLRHLIHSGAHFEIDEEKVRDEERYDGTPVRCTNTTHAQAEVP